MNRVDWETQEIRRMDAPHRGGGGIWLFISGALFGLATAIFAVVAINSLIVAMYSDIEAASTNPDGVDQAGSRLPGNPFGARQAFLERADDWPPTECSVALDDPEATADPDAMHPVRPDPSCPPTRPDYPATARINEHVGVVGLLIFVETDGRPRMIIVEKTSGFLELDESALQKSRVWRFLPARQNGDAVGAWHRINVRFRLED
jgi:TonB family protein